MLNYWPLYIIAVLLLRWTWAGTSEGKTYSQKLIETDQLGKDDQLIVQKSGTDEIAGQYFCVDGICTISYCVNCFKNQSGYLVLYNSSNLYRYDAYLNGFNLMYLNGSPLQNFTLVEDVSSTPTTTAVPDETHIPSVTQNEPFHTTKIPEDTGKARSMSTRAKVGIAFGIIGAILAFVAALVFTIARRAGRDAITKAFRSLQRKFCDREPDQQVENPIEMEPLRAKPK